MNTFRMRLLQEIPGLGAVFAGRGADPRPEPSTLAAGLGADGPGPMPVVTLRQIHSERAIVVSGREGGIAGEADALVTARRGIALGVATADCAPIVAFDPDAGALAVVHAGWRGTVAGVLPEALEAMRRDLGARAERMVLEAGPCAGVCCYEVGLDVVDRLAERLPGRMDALAVPGPSGRFKIDLVAANRMLAERAGVPPDRFRSRGLCTICRPGDFHSYRRDGAAAGRMWLFAWLSD